VPLERASARPRLKAFQPSLLSGCPYQLETKGQRQPIRMVAGPRNQASYLNHEGLLDSSNPFFLQLGAATRRSLVQIQPDSQASCLIHKGLLDSSSPLVLRL
jgi:hypothetical protein